MKWFLLCLILFVENNVFGQTFSIVSLESLPTDLTASTQARTDLNGKKCGLVKVLCVLDGINFSGNVIGDVAHKEGEYWVYMTDGSKQLYISHTKLLPFEVDLTSFLQSDIKTGNTYRLVLSIPESLYNIVITQTDENYSSYNRDSNKDLLNTHLNKKKDTVFTGKTPLGEYVEIDDYKTERSGNIYNYEYVDLGLPSGLLWATHNVGSSKPTDYGDYFAWGERKSGKKFTKQNCKALGNPISDFSGDVNFDAATFNWASVWRTPTENDWLELMKECEWVWTKVNKIFGYVVFGKNGKSIFLPASGECDDKGRNRMKGMSGSYWSSSPCNNDDSNIKAMLFKFGCADGDVDYNYREYGCSIRPVLDNKHLVSH